MLITRVLTALVLLPLMLFALFGLGPQAWAGFSWLIVVLALWEFTRMTGIDGPLRWCYLVVSTAVAGFLYLQHGTAPLWLHGIALLFWLVAAPMWLKRQWKGHKPELSMLVGWVLALPAWFGFLEWRPTPASGLTLLAIMGLVWVADIAAYFAGRAFGRRKLAPAISPGKSWEGVAGAVVAVMAYTVLVHQLGWFPHPVPLYVLLPLAVVLTAVSIVGDLMESWFKRVAGIKDSSRLLPGHGGVYDRIDSLVAVLAVSNALRVLGSL